MNSYLRKTILKKKIDILQHEYDEFKNLDEQTLKCGMKI
jgi:hypothetical protein